MAEMARAKEGGILLSVHSDNSEWTDKAKDILERTGAEEVLSAGEAKAEHLVKRIGQATRDGKWKRTDGTGRTAAVVVVWWSHTATAPRTAP